MESLLGIGVGISFLPCPLSRTNLRDSVRLLADGVGGELENHCHAHQHTRAGKGRTHGLLDLENDLYSCTVCGTSNT